MPTKKPAPLPELLRYLQPFVNALAKLPPGDLNEDVDASRLESVLRKRLSGLDEEAAEAKLAKDRELLGDWLKTRPDHPAYWVLGYLLSPDLATHLTHPLEPPPRGPKMVFETPAGWNVKPVPFRLDLKAGRLTGSIMAICELSFENMQRQQEHWVVPPGLEMTREVIDVALGEVSGKKFVCLQVEPVPWKSVSYLLVVPGGFVVIGLGTKTGADFDESSFESKLHTLRLSASE